MEGVLLSGLGGVGNERSGDVGCNERITTLERRMHTELLLDTGEFWVGTQALGDLPAVLDRKEPEAAITSFQHKVISLPNLF